ncbi:MAG: hypothetical protein SFT81_05515 [Candidatus Caenarcaniphilales bacterium]|nr:hypothetical protein [Candidatus Caenarcaniphilales bacterium]
MTISPIKKSQPGIKEVTFVKRPTTQSLGEVEQALEKYNNREVPSLTVKKALKGVHEILQSSLEESNQESIIEQKISVDKSSNQFLNPQTIDNQSNTLYHKLKQGLGVIAALAAILGGGLLHSRIERLSERVKLQPELMREIDLKKEVRPF